MEGGGLAPMLADTLAGYDRVVAYSRFGKRVIEATLAETMWAGNHVDWMPHGYNASAFQPRDRAEGRQHLLSACSTNSALVTNVMVDINGPWVGCVMANQPRKDWGLWARSMQLVAREIPNLVLWAHTDSIDRHWDLRMLLDTFGLAQRTIVTTDTPSDVEMSWRYSACDLTVLPSLGEGFGYPIVESQACGVPVLHGDCAAGTELLPDGPFRVDPHIFTLDTRYCVMRPVFSPHSWSGAILDVLRDTCWAQEPRPSPVMVSRVAHLRWTDLWPRVWQPWFEQAARQFESRNRR